MNARRASGGILLLVLAGCPSDPSNPDTLWLALNGSEVKLKLQDKEPKPF